MAVFNRCLRSLEFLSRDISRSKGGMCLSLAQEEALGWSSSGETGHLASSLPWGCCSMQIYRWGRGHAIAHITTSVHSWVGGDF